MEHYFIRLSTNIQPKLLLQEDFNALPLTLENNVFEYYNFLRKYGSHAIMEAVMGAQMFALHLHSSTDETKKYSKIFKTSDDLVKEVESLRAGDSSRLTIMTVGGTAHNNDVSFIQTFIYSSNLNRAYIFKANVFSQKWAKKHSYLNCAA